MATDAFFKKGDLEVTVLEGRGIKNGEAAQLHCAIKLRMNKTAKSPSVKGPDPKWNHTEILDLMSLNDEELLIKVIQKKSFGDHFLGQVQIPIKALSVTPEPEWYFLSDAPSDPSKATNKRSSIVITGELRVKLKFIHRLKKDPSVMGIIPPQDITRPRAQSDGTTPLPDGASPTNNNSPSSKSRVEPPSPKPRVEPPSPHPRVEPPSPSQQSNGNGSGNGTTSKKGSFLGFGGGSSEKKDKKSGSFLGGDKKDEKKRRKKG